LFLTLAANTFADANGQPDRTFGDPGYERRVVTRRSSLHYEGAVGWREFEFVLLCALVLRLGAGYCG
jgi:hypothetical protein